MAPGSSYFVTTKCWQNRTLFQVPETAETMIQTLYEYRERGVYLLHEFVVMPDHLHLLITPGATTTLEKAMQFIKGSSSHRIHKLRSHKMEIWQRGFYDWTIRDAEDWRQKAQYIRENPVVAKLVERPEAWPYSSANPKFTLDSSPEKFKTGPSGAKAPFSFRAGASELKL
jgi:REP-associated tyrosine transposase